MVFVDADKPSTAGLPEAFLAAGGQILTWRPGLTLEDEIFRHLSDQALDALLAKAETIVGAELMNAHIQTKSQGRMTLHDIKAERLIQGYLPATRELLGGCISYPQQRVVQVVDNLSGGCKGHRRPVSTERRPGLHGSHESASGRLQVPLEIDLFAIERGSITAPAGCGKTQLIAETLIAHRQSKPILVLTHTNAGVAALRARLRRAGVPNSAYRVSTIDGFSMRLIAKFPARSGHNPQILQAPPAQHRLPCNSARRHAVTAGRPPCSASPCHLRALACRRIPGLQRRPARHRVRFGPGATDLRAR